MNFPTLNKSAYDVLSVYMNDQIKRIEKSVDVGSTSPNMRKRPFDDITNTTAVPLVPSIATVASPKPPTKLEDSTVLNEVDKVLKYMHVLKQWYLGILQQKGKKDNQDDFLLCKVTKKGVTDAEEHAIKVLDYIQEYHIKRLELFSFSASEKKDSLDAEQKKTTLKITDMIYTIKKTHMLKSIITIYAEFQDIALKLFDSNN